MFSVWACMQLMSIALNALYLHGVFASWSKLTEKYFWNLNKTAAILSSKWPQMGVWGEVGVQKLDPCYYPLENELK